MLTWECEYVQSFNLHPCIDQSPNTAPIAYPGSRGLYLWLNLSITAILYRTTCSHRYHTHHLGGSKSLCFTHIVLANKHSIYIVLCHHVGQSFSICSHWWNNISLSLSVQTFIICSLVSQCTVRYAYSICIHMVHFLCLRDVTIIYYVLLNYLYSKIGFSISKNSFLFNMDAEWDILIMVGSMQFTCTFEKRVQSCEQ